MVAFCCSPVCVEAVDSWSNSCWKSSSCQCKATQAVKQMQVTQFESQPMVCKKLFYAGVSGPKPERAVDATTCAEQKPCTRVPKMVHRSVPRLTLASDQQFVIHIPRPHAPLSTREPRFGPVLLARGKPPASRISRRSGTLELRRSTVVRPKRKSTSVIRLIMPYHGKVL